MQYGQYQAPGSSRRQQQEPLASGCLCQKQKPRKNNRTRQILARLNINNRIEGECPDAEWGRAGAAAAVQQAAGARRQQQELLALRCLYRKQKRSK
jgi:hypothetical protein